VPPGKAQSSGAGSDLALGIHRHQTTKNVVEQLRRL
jgi:hypothetical protein